MRKTTNPHRIDAYRPNGVLKVPLGWRGGWQTLSFTGGPYNGYPAFAVNNPYPFGVMVRAEDTFDLPTDVHLPIKDFGVPQDDAAVRRALHSAMVAAIRGDSVYVGCMGGWGRTGLFLALIAKVAGVDNPVAYVRANYARSAVETLEQAKYVKAFDVASLRRSVRRLGWKARLGFSV